LDDLLAAAGRLAACSLLARHWPHKGSRDAAAMALTGALTRAGWEVPAVERFVYAVAVAAGDEEARMRASKGDRTAQRVEEGERVTGWPRLAELLGQDGEGVVAKVCGWLGLARPARPGTPAVKPPARYRPLPPWKPFPVDCLPPVLSDLVEAA